MLDFHHPLITQCRPSLHQIEESESKLSTLSGDLISEKGEEGFILVQKKALQKFTDEYLENCKKLSPTEIAQWLEDFRLLYGEYLGSEIEPNQLQNSSKTEE